MLLRTLGGLALAAQPALAQVDPSLELDLGIEAYYAGRLDEAIEHWERSLDQRPETADCALRLALAHARQQEFDAAFTWLEKSADWGGEFFWQVEGSAVLEEVRRREGYDAVRRTFEQNGVNQIERQLDRAALERAAIAASEEAIEDSRIDWMDGHAQGFHMSFAASPGDPDSRSAVTVGAGGAWLWDLRAGGPPVRLRVLGGRGHPAEYSPDGEYILVHDLVAMSASIHDSIDGSELRRLEPHVRSAAFVSNTLLATVDETGALEVWDFLDGTRRPIETRVPAYFVHGGFEGAELEGRCLTLDQDGACRLHDAVTGSTIAVVTDLDVPQIQATVMSDGRVLTTGEDGASTIWSRDGSRSPRRFEGSPFYPYTADRARIDRSRRVSPRTRVSPSGDRLLTQSLRDGVRLWGTGTLGLVAELMPGPLPQGMDAAFLGDVLALEGNGQVQIFTCDKGSLIEEATFRTNQTVELGATHGDRLLMSGPGGAYMLDRDGPVTVTELVGHAVDIRGIGITPEGHVLVGLDGSAAVTDAGSNWWDPRTSERAPDALRIFDSSTGRRTSSFDSAGDLVHGVLPRPGGGWVALGRQHLYDFDADGKVRNILGPTRALSGVLSPDASRLAIVCARPRAQWSQLWSLDAAALVEAFPLSVKPWHLGNQWDSCEPAFSADGALLFTAQGNEVGVWDAFEGDELGVLEGHMSHVRHLASSPTDEVLLSTSLDATARLWSLASGEVKVLPGHDGTVWSGAFHPAGTIVATAGGDTTVRLWDLEGRELHVLRGHSRSVRWVGFSPDGARLLSCSVDGTGRLWDVETGACRATLVGHAGRIWSGVFVQEGSRIVTLGDDGTVRVWEAESGRLLATRVEYTDGGWLCFEPGGYYVAGGGADEWASIQDSGRRYPLSSFASVLEKPDKVRDSLAGMAVPPPPRLTPAPLLVLDSLPYEVVDVPYFDVVASMEDPQGIRGVSLTRDGAPLYEITVEGTGADQQVLVASGGAPLPPDVARDLVTLELRRRGRREVGDLTVRVPIPEGKSEARVELRVRNGRDVLSQVEHLRRTYEPPTNDLFFLGIGVQDYDDDRLDLRYPEKDVADLVARFEAEQGRHYGKVHIQTLLNGDVRSSKLRQALAWLIREPKSNDTIIVFVAGHGVVYDEEYWFLTPEATPDPRDVVLGIPRDELTELVESTSLRANRRVLLLDTCQAGEEFDSGKRGLGVVKAFDQEEVQEKQGTGLYIFAASTEQGFAREAEGNGLFTRGLLDGLDGAADKDGDGQIQIDELISYTSDYVVEQTDRAQRPTSPRIEGGTPFTLARTPR